MLRDIIEGNIDEDVKLELKNLKKITKALKKAEEFLDDFSANDFKKWEIKNGYSLESAYDPVKKWGFKKKCLITDKTVIGIIFYSDDVNDQKELSFVITININSGKSYYDFGIY